MIGRWIVLRRVSHGHEKEAPLRDRRLYRGKAMTHEEAKKRIEDEVRHVILRNPQLAPDSAFCMWFVHAFVTGDEDAARRSLVGGSRDVGIDALHCDTAGKQVYLVQSKYRTAPKPVAEKRNDVLGFVAVGQYLLGDSKNFSALQANANASVRDRLQQARYHVLTNGYGLRLLYVTTGVVAEGLKDEANQRCGDEFRLSFHCRPDIVRLQADYVEGVAPPVPLLDLPVENNDLLRRFDADLGIESWVFSMTGHDISKVYGTTGVRLFARNIRGFLGDKTSVNKGMAYTLRNEPNRFWYYNNGITIACDSAQSVSKDGATKLRVANAQVINGQQTTRMLHEIKGHKSSVLVRVMKVPREVGNGDDGFERLVSRIVEATNWQNQIKPSDLMSNDSEQVRLERELRKRGYIYLRKRQSKGEAKRQAAEKPKAVIQKTELAQLVGSCVLDPLEVRTGKERLFETDLYTKVFSGTDINRYLTQYYLGTAVGHVSRRDPSRAYGKWVVLNFIWSKSAQLFFAASRRDLFIRVCESESWGGDCLEALCSAIEHVFDALQAFYKRNYRVDGRELDQSTFFKHKGLHTRFEGFWNQAKHGHRRGFELALREFETALAAYDE
jgi:hypothetical protein